jgi:hypothetical protein
VNGIKQARLRKFLKGSKKVGTIQKAQTDVVERRRERERERDLREPKAEGHLIENGHLS